MADVMVDSSAWVAYFRPGSESLSDLIIQLLDQERIAICGMVELELLQGARPDERKELRSLFQALSFIETQRSDFIAAGDRLAALRRKGITIPAADGLIATLCAKHRLKLLAIDKHFDYLPEIARLKP